MGSLDKSLVSWLVGNLVPVLEVLQRLGITPRIWKRLANDREFQQAVWSAVKQADVDTAGRMIKLDWSWCNNFALNGSELRAELCRQISIRNRHFMLLKDQIIQSLSSDGTRKTKVQDWKDLRKAEQLFLTFIPYRMGLKEAEAELTARGLDSANTEEALYFCLQYEGLLSGEGCIFVLGAKTLFFGSPDKKSSPSVLSLGRVMAGDPKLGLWDTEAEDCFPGGCFFLTKRPVAKTT